MFFGLDTVALTKKQEVEVADLKMVRFSVGGKNMERIRIEHIRGTAQIDIVWT